FGGPAPGNPTSGSPVYTTGNGDVSGLCWTDDRVMFDVEVTGSTSELNRISAGRDYGWPATGPGSRPGATDPALTPPAGRRPAARAPGPAPPARPSPPRPA